MSRRKQSCPQHLSSKHEDSSSFSLQQEDKQQQKVGKTLPISAAATPGTSVVARNEALDDDDDDDAVDESSSLLEDDALLHGDNPSPCSLVSVPEGSGRMMTEKEEIDAHICGQCRAEFMGLAEFLMHKKTCTKRPSVLPSFPGAGDESKQSRDSYPSIVQTEDAIRTATDEVLEKEPLLTASEPLLRSPFATVQMPLLAGVGSPVTCSNSSSDEDERLTPSTSKLPPPPTQAVVGGGEWSTTNDLGASVVLTRRLQNTNVAVAQQLAPSNDESESETGIPPKTLQATLTSLQQHQLMLMSVIHQMQAQLATSSQEHSTPPNLSFPIPFLLPPNVADHPPAGPHGTESQAMSRSAAPRSASLSPANRSPPHRHHHRQSLQRRHLRGVSSSPPRGYAASKALSAAAGPAAVKQESQKSGPPHLLPGSGEFSGSSAESGASHVTSPPINKNSSSSSSKDTSKSEQVAQEGSSPAAGESSLNTLELLQLHTEKALQNTMSGSSFLVNGISGLGGPDFLKFRKDGKEDPSYRHRCRYCGKVFGSDSALQIHIRSHTGERPFKCNICGNRFSTKGNLKVHFQRHKAKYPHVKMNPNPVPEHLDKFHPPLEPPSGSQSPSRSDSSPPPTASTSATSYAGLFAPSSSSFEGMRSAFQSSSKDFPATGSSRFGSFLSQLDLPTKSGSASNDQNRSRSSPNQMLQGLHEAAGLSAVSFSHSNDASNLSLLTEESDHESEGKRESDKLSRRKRRSDAANPLPEAKSEDNGVAGGRNGHSDSKRDKRSSDSYFLQDRQIKREKSGDEDEDDEDPISGDDEKAVPEDANGRNLRPKDHDTDPDLMDSSNADSSTGNVDDDESDGQSNQSGANSGFPGLLNASNFHNYFPPGMFPGSLAGMLPPGFPMPPGMHPERSSSDDPNAPPGSLAGDPHLYQDLLPKPGSNDNTWESLMEIQKASETTKLQHLVDNIENKLTDPNQCIICHRVLSCKSALQMHYRTHTGERPFKCKICCRAFTTKGNLKTHMGVHRVKPPLRILHQCPVCHKQFTNALVLQQHIRMHTGEPTDIPPEHILANEIKHPAQLLPSFHRQPMSLSPFGHLPHVPVSQAAVNPFFAQLINSQFSQHMQQQQHRQQQSSNMEHFIGRKEPHLRGREESPKNQKPETDLNLDRSSVSTVTSDKESHVATPHPPESPSQQTSPISNNRKLSVEEIRNPFSTSLTALENHVKTINSIEAAAASASALDQSKRHLFTRDPLTRSKTAAAAAAAVAATTAGDGSAIRAVDGRDSSRNRTSSPASVTSRDASIDGSMNADDQRSSPGSLACGRVGDENSRASVHSMPGNGALDLTPRASSRGQSPMSVGSRGLTSPGMIRPPHIFPPLFAGLPFPTGKSSTTCQICLKTFACNSALEIHYRSHTKERPFKCDVCDRGFSTKGNMKQHMLTHKIRDLPANLYTTTTTTTSAPAAPCGRQQQPQHPRAPSIADSTSQTSVATSLTEVENGGSKSESNGMHSESRGEKRSAASSGSSNSPAAKRSSSHVSKHVCSVCTKPFSSHSALQIHMRTHTGDKPFKCTICGRAFTTKGNLKVHMGTHMWNNGSARRGRRMSIDLPNLHVTPPKGADGFPQSFFPALPMAYMNGMNGQNNRATDMSSMYAAQFQAKLQACHNNSQKNCLPSEGLTAGEEEATRSDDEDPGSRNSEDEDSHSPALTTSRRNGDGSVDEDVSDGRSTPRSWTRGDECKKLSSSSSSTNNKALTAS